MISKVRIRDTQEGAVIGKADRRLAVLLGFRIGHILQVLIRRDQTFHIEPVIAVGKTFVGERQRFAEPGHDLQVLRKHRFFCKNVNFLERITAQLYRVILVANFDGETGVVNVLTRFFRQRFAIVIILTRLSILRGILDVNAEKVIMIRDNAELIQVPENGIGNQIVGKIRQRIVEHRVPADHTEHARIFIDVKLCVPHCLLRSSVVLGRGIKITESVVKIPGSVDPVIALRKSGRRKRNVGKALGRIALAGSMQRKPGKFLVPALELLFLVVSCYHNGAAVTAIPERIAYGVKIIRNRHAVIVFIDGVIISGIRKPAPVFPFLEPDLIGKIVFGIRGREEALFFCQLLRSFAVGKEVLTGRAPPALNIAGYAAERVSNRRKTEHSGVQARVFGIDQVDRRFGLGQRGCDGVGVLRGVNGFFSGADRGGKLELPARFVIRGVFIRIQLRFRVSLDDIKLRGEHRQRHVGKGAREIHFIIAVKLLAEHLERVTAGIQRGQVQSDLTVCG